MPGPTALRSYEFFGNVTRMVVPVPTWLCRSIFASCSRAMCLTMASPKPVRRCLGAALVHAVEPLKHAGLAVLRDADAVVLDLKIRAAVAAYTAAQLHMAARAVVADGIVAQILRQFAQLVAAARTVAGLASYCSVT